MSRIVKILLSLKIIEFSNWRLEKWDKNGEFELVIYALNNGFYTIREKAAYLLGKSKVTSCVPHLTLAIDDKIKSVSFAAMKAIKKIGCDSRVNKKILKKQLYWQEIEKQQSKQSNRSFTNTNYAKERRDNKRHELKQNLKRPMIGGKWI